MLIYLFLAFILGWLVSAAWSPRQVIRGDIGPVKSPLSVDEVQKGREETVELPPNQPKQCLVEIDEDGWSAADPGVGDDAHHDNLAQIDRTERGATTDSSIVEAQNPWVVEGTTTTSSWDNGHGCWGCDDERPSRHGGRKRDEPPHIGSRDGRGVPPRTKNSRFENQHSEVKWRKPEMELCDYCVRPFSAKALPKHIREVHSRSAVTALRGVPVGPPALCEVCQISLSSKAELRKHKNTEHPWSLLCTQCLQTFSNGHEAIDHYRSYHDMGGVNFDNVRITLNTSKTSRDVSDPPRSVDAHDDEWSEQVATVSPKLQTCSRCSATFADRLGLNQHVLLRQCNPEDETSQTTLIASFPPLAASIQSTPMKVTLTLSHSSDGSDVSHLTKSSKDDVASIYPESEIPDALTPDALQRGARLSDLGGVAAEGQLHKNRWSCIPGVVKEPAPVVYSTSAGPVYQAPHVYQALRSSEKPHFGGTHPSDPHHQHLGRMNAAVEAVRRGVEFEDAPPFDIQHQMPSFLFPSSPGRFSPFIPPELEPESDLSSPPGSSSPTPLPNYPSSLSSERTSGHTITAGMGPKPVPIRGTISAWSTQLNSPRQPATPETYPNWDVHHPSNDPPPLPPITRLTGQVTLADIARRPRPKYFHDKPKKRAQKPPRPPSTPALQPKFDGDEWETFQTPKPLRSQGGLQKRNDADDDWDGGVMISTQQAGQWGMTWGSQPQQSVDYGGW